MARVWQRESGQTVSQLTCMVVFSLVFLDGFCFLKDAGLKGIGWMAVCDRGCWISVAGSLSSELFQGDSRPAWRDTYVPGTVAMFDVI